jgi:outer membrane protein TolC
MQQSAQLRQARDQLRLRIDAAWRDVRLAQQRVRVRELAITQADEARRLERLRYEKGVATMTDLLAAQAELDKARSELVSARYQEVMQRAGLLLGLGRLTPNAVVASIAKAQNP